MPSTGCSRLFFLSLLLLATGQTHAQNSQLLPLGEACGIAAVARTSGFYGNGAAAADFDQDGDVDFYLTTDEGIPDRLYQNDGLGFFTDVALVSGINELAGNRTALWFDYDGDHLLDLVVAGENCAGLICADPLRLTLYRQKGDFTFEEVTDSAGLRLGSDFAYLPFFAVGGLTAGDLNGDDFLDLILTVWGGGIKYFQNNGDGTFTDRTLEAGFKLDQATPWQAMLLDFNGDGLLDVYCNVDFAPNKLWINQGGTFLNQAAAYGVDSDFNEMGMAISDYDNDGDLDIYLTNITRDFQGVKQHNVLFEQGKAGGRPFFTDRSVGLGVSQSGWDWGTTFTDINNDGRQDLLTTNGWWDERAYPTDQSKIWLNTSSGFIDRSGEYGFNDLYQATTLLAFDKDRDGDADILQTLKVTPTVKMPLVIYENNLNPGALTGKNYLTVKPRMPGANHYAIGAKVTIFAEDLQSARLIGAGCSFYGQEPAEAFFGLGERTSVQEVKVDWPGGKTSYYRNLPLNQVVELDYDFIEAPTELSISAEGDQISLRWVDNADNETRFELQQSTAADFATFTTLPLGANATGHTLPKPGAGSVTHYRLTAANDRVASGYSNAVELVIPPNSTVDPSPSFAPQNPVVGNTLRLAVSLPEPGSVGLALYDVNGRRLWQLDELISPGAGVVSLPCRVPAGIYFLRIRHDGREQIHKLLHAGG